MFQSGSIDMTTETAPFQGQSPIVPMGSNAVSPFARRNDWRSLIQQAYRGDGLNQRLDDSALGAFVNELTKIEQRLRETEYADYPAADGRMFSIRTENAPAILETGWRQIDYIGEMQLESDNSTNLPLTEIITEEFRNRVARYRGGYRISDIDMLRASYVGMNLVEQYIKACNQSYKQTLNKILLFGDPRTREPGFLNHPAWLRCRSPYKLDSSVSDADSLVSALNFGIKVMAAEFNYQRGYEPDTLILPYEQYEYLNSEVRMGAQLEKTVLQWWRETKPYIRTVQYVKELATAGPGKTPVAMFYRRQSLGSDVPFEATLTQDFRFGRVHREVSGIVRTNSFGYGGFKTYKPNAVLIMENI